MTKKGLWEDIPSLISDEMLEAISVSGTPNQVAKKIYDRYKDFSTRIAPSIFSGDPEVTSELIRLLKKIK